MSIIEKPETVKILPNESLWEMTQSEKYKNSATSSIMALIEQKQREENKELYFENFQPQWIRSNEEQKQKIRVHFFEIQTKINENYWPNFVEFYANEIIRNLFPEQAERIIESRNNIKKSLLK